MSKLHHPQPGLLLIRQDKQVMIPLEKSVTSIGRKQADIILDDAKTSSSHAEVVLEGAEAKIVDLQSTNGTYLNRRKISESKLSDQDVIEIGFTTLCFFQDIRDFHGEIERQTVSSEPKTDPSKEAFATATRSGSRITTTTRTIMQPSAQLEVLEGDQKGEKFKFRKSHILVGREEGDLVILDADMSRKHMLIEVLAPKSIYIKDLGSTNGTLVNGEKVMSSKLKPGDLVKTGNTVFRFTIEGEAKS